MRLCGLEAKCCNSPEIPFGPHLTLLLSLCSTSSFPQAPFRSQPCTLGGARVGLHHCSGLFLFPRLRFWTLTSVGRQSPR